MKTINYISVVCLSLSTLGWAQESVELKEEKKQVLEKKIVEEKQAKVQIAILLDSSTSMNGGMW